MYQFTREQIRLYNSQGVTSVMIEKLNLPLHFGYSSQIDLTLLENPTNAWVSTGVKGPRKIVIASEKASNIPIRSIYLEGSQTLEVKVVGIGRSPTFEIKPK
tara:strand:+ start:891 stop:1196 length:306 start_codon:yes stop_codon:yes gene_type:complete